MDLASLGNTLSVWFLPVIIAITLHEAAHGWMADKLGDSTARSLGRVTLNPIRHIDPFGTLLLPGILLFGAAMAGVSPLLFGWAKPVPVAFGRLNNPKRDMIWVALAGPGINIAIAFVSAMLLYVTPYLSPAVGEWVSLNLINSLQINVVLAVFNMIPIPPLDGGRVLTGLLPMPYAYRFAQLERYGLLIIMGLLFIVPLVSAQLGARIDPFRFVMGPAVNALVVSILRICGFSV